MDEDIHECSHSSYYATHHSFCDVFPIMVCIGLGLRAANCLILSSSSDQERFLSNSHHSLLTDLLCHPCHFCQILRDANKSHDRTRPLALSRQLCLHMLRILHSSCSGSNWPLCWVEHALWIRRGAWFDNISARTRKYRRHFDSWFESRPSWRWQWWW